MSHKFLLRLFTRACWPQREIRHVSTVVVAALALLISSEALNAAAAVGACVGDCDGTGQVTVNEILEMVNIALGLDAVPACRAGDANHDGVITIDEILKAVALALTRCPLEGSAAGEAASGVDGSTRDGTDAACGIIDFGKAGTGGGGGGAILQRARTNLGGAALSFACPAGGDFTMSSCSTSQGVSTLTLMFFQCREVDSQTMAATTRSGLLKLTVADPGVCATGQIPAGTTVTSEYDQFVTDTVDAVSQTTTRVGMLTDVFQPSGQGCGVTNGIDTINGTLSLQHDPGAPASGYAYHNLVVETFTAPNPAACITQKKFNGILSADDQVLGRSFSETLRDFVVTDQQLAAQRIVSESGTLASDCLGAAKFKTLEPLHILTGNPCPTAGVLEVTLPDGTITRTQYSPNGVAFDFNGDGQIDKQVASCLDPMLAQCTETSP